MFCAEADEKSDACIADYGSPFFQQIDSGENVLTGIFSFGMKNCKDGAIAYTKVSAYLDFINAVMKGKEYKCQG